MDDVLSDFCRGMYGPAFEPMKRYWQRWIDAHESAGEPDFKRGGWHPRGIDRHFRAYRYDKAYPPDLIHAAYQDLQEAKTLVADGPERHRQRVEFAYLGLRFTDLWLSVIRQAYAKDYPASVKTGRSLLELIEDEKSRPRPVAFSRFEAAAGQRLQSMLDAMQKAYN